jgi:hypothetical protein
MFPTHGPAVPVTNLTFSSNVSWETKLLACSNAASHPVPVAFAGRMLACFQDVQFLFHFVFP